MMDWSEWTERRLWLVETLSVLMLTSVVDSLGLWLSESGLWSLCLLQMSLTLTSRFSTVEQSLLMLLSVLPNNS